MFTLNNFIIFDNIDMIDLATQGELFFCKLIVPPLFFDNFDSDGKVAAIVYAFENFPIGSFT